MHTLISIFIMIFITSLNISNVKIVIFFTGISFPNQRAQQHLNVSSVTNVLINLSIKRVYNKKLDPLEAVKTFKGRWYGPYYIYVGNHFYFIATNLVLIMILFYSKCTSKFEDINSAWRPFMGHRQTV